MTGDDAMEMLIVHLLVEHQMSEEEIFQRMVKFMGEEELQNYLLRRKQ